MKISFVIPAYNEESVIAKCLASVEAEIKGIENECEIIVVNNNCTDKTKAIAQTFTGVKVVDEVRKGLTFARQAGFLSSTGDLIANIDADTILPKGWLKEVFKEFDKDSKMVALSGPYIYYDLNIIIRFFVKIFYFFGLISHYFNQYVFHNGAMLQGGNFVLKREALNKIGGFDTSIVFYGEDTDIAKRISKVGKVKWTFCLPMYTSGRRLKEEGVLKVGIKYAVNFFWINFFNKPFTEKYIDIRK